jgi:hypothetical protein
MARLLGGLDGIWIFWKGPSSRRVFPSETIPVGRRSIACRLAFSPSRRWSFGAEAVLWIVYGQPHDRGRGRILAADFAVTTFPRELSTLASTPAQTVGAHSPAGEGLLASPRRTTKAKFLERRVIRQHANMGESHVAVVHQIHVGHRGR